MSVKSWYPGQRLSYGKALCTVRYCGSLQDTKGEWLGVEWDDTSRGKHDGHHQGRRIFGCLSSSPTAGSFVRPTRAVDKERTVLDAIRFKYGSGITNGSEGYENSDVVIISGKVAQEVGFDKIAREQSQLADLKIVLLDQFVVTGVAPRGSGLEDVKSAQRELSETCPNIVELDLGWNPIERWQDVADICAALPKLKILKAGGLRLRDFAFSSTNESPFSHIQELQLDESSLRPEQILTLIHSPQVFPNLQTLSISQNGLSAFVVSDAYERLRFTSVTTLRLENNHFQSLSNLPRIFAIFPSLTNISFRGNAIVDVGKPVPEAYDLVSLVTSLNISHNKVASFSFVDSLPSIFPKLEDLQISKNPIYDATNSASSAASKTSSDTSYYLTLARIASLKTLNYTTITARDREEGEIYYLSIAEREIKALISSAVTDNDTSWREELSRRTHALFPRYQPLCEKYDRDSLLTQLTSPDSTLLPSQLTTSTSSQQKTYPPGSVGSRLINATFYLPDTTPPQSLTRTIPSTIPVNTVKALLTRQFASPLPPLQFRLIYESPDLDPVEPVEWSTRSAAYDKTTPKETRWREWGDWDADAVVEAAIADEENGGGGAEKEGSQEEERWTADGFLVRDGRRWRRREVEIVGGMRAWGDWIEGGAGEVRVRIERF